ncbi:MAG: extracellular solute-binding protein, partial [Patescibacteria group bacterium]
LNINYVVKNPQTFDTELVEAIAVGNGPDIIFLRDDSILKNKNKVLPIPYKSLPQQTFDATFVGEGGLYLDTEGVLGVPLTLDPLVLYYNTGMLDTAGIPTVPQYWDEVLLVAPNLTTRDASGTITRSTIAMGHYDNVPHAKDIIAMLIMQSGGQLVGRGPDGYVSALNQRPAGALLNPASEALTFYTEFANPLKAAYSWNKAQPNAQDAFIAGSLAMYIGYASELFTIRNKNPNLGFKVAPIPQIRGAQGRLTFGRINALAVIKSSKNVSAAVSVVGLMTGKDASKVLTTALSLAPVRRDIIAERPLPTDPTYATVFYNAALVARGWLDPDQIATNTIFRTMINNALSGADTAGSALSTAHEELDFLLRKI